jgi:hypothetical protein
MFQTLTNNCCIVCKSPNNNKFCNTCVINSWNEFKKKTKLTHHIFTSDTIANTIIDEAINTGYSVKSYGTMFLGLNGHLNFEALMFTSEIVDNYIKNKIINNTKYSTDGEKENLIIILGQTIIDPWNSSNIYIKRHFGKQPNNLKELYELWIDNKKRVQNNFKSEIIYTCKCGFEKYLKDFDITKNTESNYVHIHKKLNI